MPIRKIEKPSKQETQLATEVQAPKSNSKLRKLREPEAVDMPGIPQFRSLKDTGIDGARHEFIKPPQLFNSDESETSMAFGIHGARLSPNTLSPGKFNVIFTISLWGEDEKYQLSLPQDASRDQWVAYFATNTIPVGPMELVRLPNANPKLNDYLALNEATIPF